jgi:hypothetical protein
MPSSARKHKRVDSVSPLKSRKDKEEQGNPLYESPAMVKGHSLMHLDFEKETSAPTTPRPSHTPAEDKSTGEILICPSASSIKGQV